MNTILLGYTFLSQKAEISLSCFNQSFQDLSSRKPVNFHLVKNTSLLLSFLNNIILKMRWTKALGLMKLRTYFKEMMTKLLSSPLAESLSEMHADEDGNESWWHMDCLCSSKQQTRCVTKSCKGSICAQNIKDIKIISMGKFSWQRNLSLFWQQRRPLKLQNRAQERRIPLWSGGCTRG